MLTSRINLKFANLCKPPIFDNWDFIIGYGDIGNIGISAIEPSWFPEKLLDIRVISVIRGSVIGGLTVLSNLSNNKRGSGRGLRAAAHFKSPTVTGATPSHILTDHTAIGTDCG